MRALRSLALVAATLLVASCSGDSGTGPQAGVLRLTLNTPNSGDGAILFKVTGDIDSVQGGLMMQDGRYTIGATFTRIVVAGDLTDGPVAYLFVPDIHDLASYVSTVEQVAVKATNAQRSVAGYTVTAAVE